MFSTRARFLIRMHRAATLGQANAAEAQREEAARRFPPLQALIGGQLTEIENGLAELARHAGGEGLTPEGGESRWVEPLGAPSSCGGREIAIIRGIADLHAAMGATLRAAAFACLDQVGDLETAGALYELAARHKKDASTLRALLWEDPNP